ncbi:MAG: fused MFS/spermidine synthase [Lachnospiraceae bacterium]|nr:fused MFS/spermidine synthase [Lachnospiraceae bacterium]
MAVELGASRLLAPYFSSSQIVWTIIIGTIMIAMALGNLYGGRAADKNHDPGRLYRRLLIAAVWIAAIPLVGKYIILAVTGLMIIAVNTWFLIWAAFAACMVIFVFPLFLLGTVTPSLVKYATDSLDDNGRVVGTLGAWNTIGSILGTFLPTFVTIPAVGTAVTFLLFSGILLVIASIYFLSSGKKKTAVIISGVMFILCAFFGNSDSFAFWERDLTYEGESVYNYLQVRDTPQATILSTNVLFGVQSIRMKEGGLTGMYYDDALAAPVMARFQEKEHPTALVLGMGTGTWAMQLKEFFPDCEVEGVEIDEDITRLAHTYFALDPSIPVTTYDGRAFLQAVDGTYDCIMVDAYRDITIPFSMSSVEFFTLVKEHLKPDGVMVVNMNMRDDEPGNINACLSDTIASVFPSVLTVDVRGSTNRELFASETELTEAFARGRTELAKAGDNSEMSADLRDRRLVLADRMTQTADRQQVYRGGGYLLTDDKAPVELLGMRVIDGLIRDEIGYYKQRFREEGIRGLLEAI